MALGTIAAFIAAAGLLGFIRNIHWRQYLLLGASSLAIFILQPTLPVRGLDFFLPTLTLSLAILAWVLTTPREMCSWRENWAAAVLPGGIVLVLGLTRYSGLALPLTASRPPQITAVVMVLGLTGLLAGLLTLFTKPAKAVLVGGFVLILALFLAMKVPGLTLQVSRFLRMLNEQSLATASVLDVRWLGFSYIAFRILHTIRDRQSGRLPPVSLAEYVIYIIFFPALSAGPIDRIERFLGDLRQPVKQSTADWVEAGKRLMIGLFKKFAIADSLALVSLGAANALQVRTAGWAWVLLYAYAFQIYLDFSGYTDIAIGTARLMGFRLPENFHAPLLKPNLTQFWNNWHITLTQWFRAYFFNPLTRALRSGKKKLPVALIILITQMATMVMIGLWHGVTWNFVLWGLWHGLGLFLHNRWSERTKACFARLTPGWQKALNAGGMLVTFHYVALGWVFFALPEVNISLHFFQILFGSA